MFRQGLLDLCPLMIRRGDFCVGGDLWRSHRERFGGAEMVSFLDTRFARFRRRAKRLMEFYRARPAPKVIGESSSPRIPKEEPADLDFVDDRRRYCTFYGSLSDL